MHFFQKLQNIDSYKKEAYTEFIYIISPLLNTEEVQKLDTYVQHYNCTRLRHSLDVAYLSFFIAKLLNCDSRSTARAALLHDMFYREDDEPNTLSHLRNHPAEALCNAKKICALNNIEEDIILKHMWLINMALPRYKESFIVTFVDKFCAVREFATGLFSSKLRRNVFDTSPRLFYSHEYPAEAA